MRSICCGVNSVLHALPVVFSTCYISNHEEWLLLIGVIHVIVNGIQAWLIGTRVAANRATKTPGSHGGGIIYPVTNSNAAMSV